MTTTNVPQELKYSISNHLGLEDEYFHLQLSDNGTVRAAGKENFTYQIERDGTTTITRNQLNWSLRLAAIDESIIAVGAEQDFPAPNRLEQRRDNLTSFWANGPGGLQQGWIIDERADQSVPLILCFEHSDASAVVYPDRVDMGEMQFTGLIACDRTGRSLDVKFVNGDDLFNTNQSDDEQERPGRSGPMLVLMVDDSEARYPITVDPWVTTNTPAATLTNSSGVPGDNLGISAAISGDGTIALIGANDAASGAGAAYIFVQQGGSWMTTAHPTATLTRSGGVDGDNFAYSVALSTDGSIALIGNNSALVAPGVAYIYVQPGGGWMTTSTPTASITHSGSNSDDFGVSVALAGDGNTALIGAPGRNSSMGDAYIFVKPGGGWASTGTPTATLSYSLELREIYLARVSLSVSMVGSLWLGRPVSPRSPERPISLSKAGVG